ncbi:HdeA/HdeB family chaperone [Methylocapsa acidiphila]|uniref:HdeA/HdeB family chaperone n=1 Tax=Methylocapsa acidiphila TaxID=133552 RepID=UPI000422FE3E|nr:HdeA/HdeB family chaperone [Methylocapsa acidiphila]
MRHALLAAATITACLVSSAKAQTPLSAYADPEGYINVQALTCAELAGTFQEDADLLTTWYSGWYNGLAKKHFINVKRSKEAEHETIVYCKAHPEKKVIEAIGTVIDEMRAKSGIELSK